MESHTFSIDEINHLVVEHWEDYQRRNSTSSFKLEHLWGDFYDWFRERTGGFEVKVEYPKFSGGTALFHVKGPSIVQFKLAHL